MSENDNHVYSGVSGYKTNFQVMSAAWHLRVSPLGVGKL